MTRLSLFLVFCVALAGCNTGGDEGRSPSPNPVVVRYCSYGVVSKAQLRECIRNVGPRSIDRLDTNAARFAHGGSRCLADAGPFCRRAEAQARADYYGSL